MLWSNFTTYADEVAEVAKAGGPGLEGPDAFHPSPRVVRPYMGESLILQAMGMKTDQGPAGETVIKKSKLCKRPPFQR